MVRLTTEEHLHTQMHKLMPDCHTFNRWFVEYSENGRRILNEDSIPTLAEFLSKNNHPLEDRERLWCGDRVIGFARQSASFQKLRQFLVDKGFTNHWIVLGQRKRQLNLFPMSVLKQRDVRDLPFIEGCKVKKNSMAARDFFKLVKGVTNPASITVAQVLNVTQEQIEGLTGRKPCWLMNYDQVQSLRIFIRLVQKKLRAAGLSEEDGAFMSISFDKKKMPPGMNYYLKRRVIAKYGSDVDFTTIEISKIGHRYAI